MNWFARLRLSSQLILAFLLVACIAGAVGTIGILNIRTLARSDKFMYESATAPMKNLDAINGHFQLVRNSLSKCPGSGQAGEGPGPTGIRLEGHG